MYCVSISAAQSASCTKFDEGNRYSLSVNYRASPLTIHTVTPWALSSSLMLPTPHNNKHKER